MTDKIRKTVNLDKEVMDYLNGLFHEFRFNNFSATLNALFKIILSNSDINKRVKDELRRK